MEILIIFLLILLNGIFAMSEIALVSARKFKLESASKKGNHNAKKALELSNNPTRFLSTVQIGITLIGILTGIFSGEKITLQLEGYLSKNEIIAPYANSLAVLIVVVVVTFFSIVFGELIPKRIGLIFPETIATLMAKPMTILSKIASPFIWLLSITNDLFLWMLRLKNTSDSKVTEEEVKAIVQQSAEGGEIQEIEHDIVHRVFALGDRKVTELMTYRTDIVWFDINDSIETVRQKCKDEPHSVYLVADGTIDKLSGVISIKEMFASTINSSHFSIKDYLKKPILNYDSTPAYKVLEKFRELKWHFGIVVDEYGSIQGVITMDDVLDALVGDVSEYDQSEYGIIERKDGTWLADAQYPYFELLHYFDINEFDTNTEGEFTTIAGLILHKTGRIPEVGDKIRWEQFTFEVIDMDGMRIDKVLISLK